MYVAWNHQQYRQNWLAEKLSKNIHLKDTCKWCDIVFLI
ncbi:hypothetical protein J690_1500 [Acinetobacter sp. 742879]|nr:hypothetical protein J508_2764 [Acinetobacter sp. 1289694]EXS29087.1 hypothetical protein J690_1500 [Acinetobacter sp. 742879]EXS36698.1 hypothetical protein J663_0839 [Acinetobacter sp. 826659]